MKVKNLEIERWDMEEFIDTIVERVSEQISVNVNCEDLSPCWPCEGKWLTTEEVLGHLQISRPTLDGMRKRGELKSRRVGRGYRYQI